MRSLYGKPLSESLLLLVLMTVTQLAIPPATTNYSINFRLFLGLTLVTATIRAHRNPSGCMPSVCTLIQSLGELYYEPSCTNSKFIGKKAYETAAYVLDKGIESLQTLGADCIHVKYDNLIADPIQTVKDIYNYYGWEFTVEYHDILKEFLRIDKKKRDGIRKKMSRTTTTSASGLHQHNLEQFGITKESLTTGKYKKYIDQYQL